MLFTQTRVTVKSKNTPVKYILGIEQDLKSKVRQRTLQSVCVCQQSQTWTKLTTIRLRAGFNEPHDVTTIFSFSLGCVSHVHTGGSHNIAKAFLNLLFQPPLVLLFTHQPLQGLTCFYLSPKWKQQNRDVSEGIKQAQLLAFSGNPSRS